MRKREENLVLVRPGVTLLEILIATTLVVMAVIPVVGAFQSGFGLMKRQEEHLAALSLAESVISFCRARVTDPAPAVFHFAGVALPVGTVLVDPHQSRDARIRFLSFPPAPSSLSYGVTFDKPDTSGSTADGEELLEEPGIPALAASIRRRLLRITVEVRWGGAFTSNLRLKTLVVSTHGY